MAPRPCLALRLAAEAACAVSSPALHFVHFWPGFSPGDDDSVATMFRAVFGGLGLRKPVAIWSVFPQHHRYEDVSAFRDRDRYVQVGFSGEGYHWDLESRDLNLIMAPDDPGRNVVSYVNFATNAHEFGLWPLFSLPRPRRHDKKFAVAVVSNHEGTTRNRFITRLGERRRFDSCGAWMNNTGFFAPRDERDFGDRYYPFLQRYKFMVCFENRKQSHYVTEKLAHAYAAGCVPVYWGAPEARRWFNPRAFLSLEDETDAAMDAVIERMLALDEDDGAFDAAFSEPLLPDGIPHHMRLETIREKVAETLRRTRPDAF